MDPPLREFLDGPDVAAESCIRRMQQVKLGQAEAEKKGRGFSSAVIKAR
jgi:hypothetical protein